MTRQLPRKQRLYTAQQETLNKSMESFTKDYTTTVTHCGIT